MREVNDFETTEELRNFVVNLIRATGLCGSLSKSHPTEYDFFRTLFQRHPEGDRKGVTLITDISIRRYPKSRGPILEVQDHQFWILKSDGTECSISWNSCVKGAVNPVGKKLNWAFRQAVEGQIKEFRSTKKGVPCEFCGTHAELTVDHITKFRQLKEDFLALHPEHPTQFGKNELAQEIFREEDLGYRRLWEEYHRQNANLRILCKSCNRKLDNYGSFFI
jgi:hypothetical protein